MSHLNAQSNGLTAAVYGVPLGLKLLEIFWRNKWLKLGLFAAVVDGGLRNEWIAGLLSKWKICFFIYL